MPPFIRLLALFTAIALLPACTVYRLDIQQGNFVDQEMRDKLEVGMTREQVLFVMGTPMVQDPFHPNRWDYVYYLDSRYDERDRAHRLTVFFENDRVSNIVAVGFEDIEKAVYQPLEQDDIERDEEPENAEDLKNLPGTEETPLEDESGPST